MLSTRADFVAVREQLATLGQRSLLVEAKREEMAAERDEARRLLQVEEAKGQKASSELRGLRDQLESAAIREKALIEEMAKLEAEKVSQPR